jgi:hypothetical protein
MIAQIVWTGVLALIVRYVIIFCLTIAKNRRCLMPEPILTRVNHSGAWVVSDIVAGYRVSRTYYGYSSAQALRAFLDEFGGVK